MSLTETPESLLREAAHLRREGRVPEAIAAYKKLLAGSPDMPDSWYNLGLLQRHAGRFEEALTSYQQALDRGVSGPEEVRLNRGVIYADHLRDDVAAERELRAALELNPNYAPALFNLANLNEDQGDRRQALALYERVLELAPDAATALARYAILKGASSANDPLILRLRAAIARQGATAGDKASLGFALGRLLDRNSAYDEAFAAYVAANAESRLSGEGFAYYDRREQETLIDRIVAAFPAPAANATGAAAAIFICGMFRSGSTLAEQVLACQPRVTAGGELDVLPSIVRAQFPAFPNDAAKAADEVFASAAQHYRDGLHKLFPRADRVTDKRPDNFLYVGLIKRMFPAAKIVHTVRDPLDMGLSNYFLHLDHRMAYALDLGDIGHYYRQYRRLMTHWKTLYPDDILDFDYDAFVRDARPHAERLLAFCGLEWDEACLTPHLAAGAVKTASVWQVREPLYQKSSGRWRNYERHLGPLRDALGDAG